MRSLFLGSILVLGVGCAKLASILVPPPPPGAPADPVLVAQAEVETRQREVASLRVQLQQAEVGNAPTLPTVRADLQLAETQLEAAEAKVVRAKVEKGLGYTEVAAKLISTPLQIFFPAAGPILTGILALVGASRSFFGGGPQKPEVK